MNTRKRKKLIHEGKYVAELEVELEYTDDEWSPYLTLADAYRLDDVREALRRGDVATAAKNAKATAKKRASTNARWLIPSWPSRDSTAAES